MLAPIPAKQLRLISRRTFCSRPWLTPLYLLFASALGCALGCVGPEDSPAEPTSDRLQSLVLETPDGLDFVHDNGATGSYYYPEMMQGGGGFLDFDGDGLLDVYMVQSGTLPPNPAQTAANRLFRNRGNRQFTDVTASSGVADNGYGSSLAAADYDGDGWTDLFVTNLGTNRLFKNLGDGSFEDTTDILQGDPGSYSTCAAFFDMDQDGDLDLYVCNYVEWSAESETRCLGFNGQQGYCGPQEYEPAHNELYRNEDGRFVSVGATSGIQTAAGATLGLAIADFDSDGDLDLYVANDQMANHLWINDGSGHFVDEALERGAAYNQQGFPEAGMGVIAEDFDEDGDWDLFVTHLGNETNTLYLNDQGLFFDATDATGLGAISQAYTGFGVGLFDFDGDGFRDLDNDGATDALVAVNNGRPRIYFGKPADDADWLGVQIQNLEPSGASGLGNSALHSRVTLELESGATMYRRVETSSSYAAANDPRVLFRIASNDVPVRLTVSWPGGRSREILAPENRRYHLVERE